MTPGARSKFGAPMFEFEVVRKLMYCIEERAMIVFLSVIAPQNNVHLVCHRMPSQAFDYNATLLAMLAR